jgi:hypothetical protein
MPETKCPNLDKNNEQCPCGAKDCERHGLCCDCLRAHLAGGSLPACAKHLAAK